jgi:3-oxoadipate enol-lactonase
MMGEQGFVEIDDGRLYYERDGVGPAVVLIAGGFLDVRMYSQQVEALLRDYSLIRCDLRGFGRSSTPTGAPYRHCDDLRRLLDELGIDRACFGGESLGGTVALDVAFAHPELVNGLILAPALPVLGWEWVEGFPIAPAFEVARREGSDAFAAAFLDLPLIASAMAIPDVAASLRQMVGDYSCWHMQHRDPGTFEAPDAIDRLHEVDAPALVVVGGHDVLDSQLVAERLATGLVNSEHHLIDHVGHAPNMEDAAVFNSLALDFLGRVGTGI